MSIDFKEWCQYRNNEINLYNEKFADWIKGLFANRKAGDSTPTEPTQIYNHPMVIKYYNQILAHLNLNQQLDVINNKGEKTGDFSPNSIPAEVEQAFKRFIAGHILGKGQERSFLRVSAHDAAIIINFLDHLKMPNSDVNLADYFRISHPLSLSQWVQTKVPLAPDAIRQTDYEKDSNRFSTERAGRLGKKIDPLKHPKFGPLMVAARDVVVDSAGKKVGVSRFTHGFLSKIEVLRRAMEDIVPDLVPSTPAPQPQNAPNNVDLDNGVPAVPG